MANTTNIIPNKPTMYQRVEGGVWHYRIKLKTGEWYRISSRETDFDEAKEIANRTYYTADYKELYGQRSSVELGLQHKKGAY